MKMKLKISLLVHGLCRSYNLLMALHFSKEEFKKRKRDKKIYERAEFRCSFNV